MQSHGYHLEPDRVPVCLTVAGSDSGGGAGIQADLKTFTRLGAFGTTAITCVTAQNPKGVDGVWAADPVMVAAQIRMACEAFPPAAAKTGMLFNADIIRAVAASVEEQGIATLVVDPVMVAASGARLLEAEAVDALTGILFPLARVVTPNIAEAEILLGEPIRTVEELRVAAREIARRFDTACVAKGAHLEGDRVVDVLFDRGEEEVFESQRIDLPETHGAGCTFSAALTAFLAHGALMVDAAREAKALVADALKRAAPAGHHRPLNLLPPEPA